MEAEEWKCRCPRPIPFSVICIGGKFPNLVIHRGCMFIKWNSPFLSLEKEAGMLVQNGDCACAGCSTMTTNPLSMNGDQRHGLEPSQGIVNRLATCSTSDLRWGCLGLGTRLFGPRSCKYHRSAVAVRLSRRDTARHIRLASDCFSYKR